MRCPASFAVDFPTPLRLALPRGPAPVSQSTIRSSEGDLRPLSSSVSEGEFMSVKGILKIAFQLLIVLCFCAVTIVSAQTPKVSTVAGGFDGNSNAATSTGLANPAAIAVDKGNLYIAESLGCEIRKVDKTGIITRFA